LFGLKCHITLLLHFSDAFLGLEAWKILMLQVNLTSCGEKPTAVTSEILGSVEIVELPCSECHSSQVFLKLSDVAVLALPSNKQREVMQLLRSCKSYNKDSMF